MCIRDRRGVGGRDRHGVDGALAGADDVGVAPVGDRVGGEHGAHPGGVRRAQHRAQVAGLLHALREEHERSIGQGQVCLLYTSRCV